MNEEAAYLARLAALHAKNWPAGVPRESHYPFGRRPLSEYLRERARLQPHKPVVVFYGRELGFGELDALSDRFAALLAARGVQRGDRVAVFMPNCPQFLVAFYGILKLGAVHVPVNPLFKAEEVLYELRDSGAQVMLALDQLMDVARAARAQGALRHLFVTSFADMRPDHPTLPLPAAVAAARIDCPDAEDLLPALATTTPIAPDALPPPGLDDVAALNYTGGTTGLPKGCVHTQADMLYTAAATHSISVDLREDDVGIGINPAFWIAGENALLIQPVFSGVTVVMLARWDPVAWMAAVQRYRVSFAGLVLDSAVEVMEHPDVARYDLRSLRSMRVSSFVKKLGMGYRERWRALTGTTMIESAWGMTETHTNDSFTRGMQEGDFDLHARPIFVGLPMPGTEFKVCDFDTGALLPLGSEGELCCRTPSLLKGYWNKPEANAQTLRGGWLHTGDIAMLDEHGYLHFLGRRKEMLKVKGMSVFPAEVEALLGMHPAVLGSGVVGRADADRGEVPVAFVRLDPAQAAGCTAQALQDWCRERMASYKVPEIRLVERLATSATGKVLKNELTALLAQERGAGP
ncbi:AMP-binding protein [Pseudorhodoferax soli]|uniref:Fatty-acyl-CoA synthase n=1 Tax=Pseudorhodoferax soli TaxID=545864 RepID=A0A368XNG1_9BURK|nr:AMP-binding protein [Pseudorhodoferax soli]RCW67554.1 fatty-acyl-CoA synthase [Pseudorhodoferax soli]